jgi:hypothetical protein
MAAIWTHLRKHQSLVMRVLELYRFESFDQGRKFCARLKVDFFQSGLRFIECVPALAFFAKLID